MPEKTKTEPSQPDTFAGRRAEREARESVEGPTPRRQFANRVRRSEEFVIDGTVVRHVRA
jgi:hypothetical protein